MLPMFRAVRRVQQNRRLISRRISNRQQYNSFDLPDARFIELYRRDKNSAMELIDRLRPYIHSSHVRRGVTVEVKVLCALRFYATGSYQRCVGEEYNLRLSQTTVHRYMHEVTNVIVNVLSEEFVRFPQTSGERNRIKAEFMRRMRFPGITHIAILKPLLDEPNFINRKGFHSINTQTICDHELKILYINANFGGSTHDSFIFNHSNVKAYLQQLMYTEPNSWLIGDSGYAQLPYLMVPIRNALEHTPEARYNQALLEARNVIERYIGLLKTRFRCLLKEREARYGPIFMSQVIKACVILHNYCIDQHIPFDEPFIFENEIDVDRNHPRPREGQQGLQARQNVLNLYFQ